MIVIGLTGSIGMGKTTAANMLREQGIPVHCSDEAVHALYNNPEVIAKISAAFPGAYDKKSHSIDRDELKKALAYDHQKLDMLQAILHPLVQQAQNDFLRRAQIAGAKMAVLDIPLLFETGAEQRLDCTLCVSAPPFIQRQRVMARPGMSEVLFQFLLARQMPDSEKKKRADFVIPTGLGLAYTRQKLEDALVQIKKKHQMNKNGNNTNNGTDHESRRFPPYDI